MMHLVVQNESPNDILVSSIGVCVSFVRCEGQSGFTARVRTAWVQAARTAWEQVDEADAVSLPSMAKRCGGLDEADAVSFFS